MLLLLGSCHLSEIARVTVENIRRFAGKEAFLEGTVLSCSKQHPELTGICSRGQIFDGLEFSSA